MTTPIHHILVPTDGSEFALKAAAYAGNLARALDARVSILMVHSDELLVSNAWGAGAFPAGAANAAMSIEDIRGNLERHAREHELAETVAAVGKLAHAPEATQRWGHATEEICKFAEERGVDLVVMGSHGRSGFKRVLLGSISNAVANHAQCPVTIVR